MINSVLGNITSSNTVPFFVTTRTNPSNSSLFQAKVSIGDLLLSLQPSNNLTITGLDTWFNLDANDLIWIYITVLNYAATAATIQSYGQGNSRFTPTLAAWDDTGGFVQDDGGIPPKQIAANCMVAESTANSNGKPVITQKLFNNLLIENCSIDGVAAIFPFPSTYGRYI
jgi:hypothetical protein